MVIQGRTVRPEDVARIGDWLQAHPNSNRTRLSREVCLAWDWRDGAGRLKDMAARVLLLKLEARGHIQLPPRRTASVNGLRHRDFGQIAHDQSPLEGPLEKLQPVRIEPVIGTTAEARLFQFLLARYHYLGHRHCLGENLRYLAQDRQGRPLACLLFSSAAWKAAARDQWLGWSSQQRRSRLELVANNTRFLLLPWIGVRSLSSHLLGQITARLSADWQRKYGHPIYLVESFVEPGRFAGTCYQAAGWIPVGLTTGRTRNDDGLKPRVARKAIYLKVLRADALRRLAG
jgi:Druantia protein DruA